MKKITLKLKYDELSCFINCCNEFAKDATDNLIEAVLMELWVKIRHKADFNYNKTKTIQLTVAEAIAFCRVVGKVALDRFDAYTLAVIAPVYQTIDKQIKK